MQNNFELLQDVTMASINTEIIMKFVIMIYSFDSCCLSLLILTIDLLVVSRFISLCFHDWPVWL